MKCGCIQECCECARLGMRSRWYMLQVAVRTKTNRFGAVARQLQVSPPCAHYDRGWESHPVVVNWERGHGGCWSFGSRGGMEYHSEKITKNHSIFRCRGIKCFYEPDFSECRIFRILPS